MPRLIAPILAFALGLGAAFAIVSCGGSDKGLLPGDKAEQISANLEAVQDQANAGDCASAQDAAAQVSDQVEALGPEVGSRLREALSEGAAQLESVATDCTETTEAETVPDEPLTDTEPTTEETDTEGEEPTEPPPTEPADTTPTEPPPEEPPPTATPPPPPDDGGGSGGIGPGATLEGSG